MLEIQELQAGYGEVQVIHGIELQVQQGEFHAILGRNGVGKSTTLKTVIGLLHPFGGDIKFKGRSLVGREPFSIVNHGIAYVPETRDIFGSLSVRENLELAARLSKSRGGDWTLERVLEFFPQLKDRLSNGGSQLSGGEQQMLAIARALLMNPELLILDEPTEGLAPIIVRQIFEKLRELKEDGLTVLLVEQNFQFATLLADTASVFGRGQCVWSGTADTLRNDSEVHERWIGV